MRRFLSKKTVFFAAGGFVFAAFFLVFQSPLVLSFGHPDANQPGPFVLIISPASGTPFRSSQNITIGYSATDPYGDASMAASGCKLWTKSDGSALGGFIDRGVVDCGSRQITTVNAGWCNLEGTNLCVVRITAQDTAGYTARDEIFLTIDDTPPVVHLSSNRGHPTEKTDVSFEFLASDEYGIASIQCDLDGRGFADCTSPQNYAGPLPEGNHTFSVRATDKAGNQTTKSITWEIDSQMPVQISSTDLDVAAPTPSTNHYFSLELNWQAPDEDATDLADRNAAQYDIRYSLAPITTEAEWNNRTAIIYDEYRTVSPPQSPGNIENMLIGPATEAGIAGKVLGDGSNLLPSNIPLYFAIKSRDEKWNWSTRKDFAFPATDFDAFTRRDPCDYDGDGFYSPDCGAKPHECNPAAQTCDIYDDPFDWQLPNEPNEYTWSAGPSASWQRNRPDEYWIRAFAAATQDLDNDGKGAANSRLGVKVVAQTSPGSFPNLSGTDWYDNPFTLDLLAIAIPPTLEQLAHTVNDLDLDTFVVKTWRDLLGGTENADAEIAGAINADVSLDASNSNIAGCIYPNEAMESRCTDCTAYNPNPATGRIPPNKTVSDALQNKAVCQIEAYYADLRQKSPPDNYEVIQLGTADPARELFSASAQCQDGVDNDLDGLIDSRQDETDQNFDVACPLTYQPQSVSLNSPKIPTPTSQTAAIFDSGELVQCGRNADDFKTPIDESADCTFCHFFYLFQNLLNLLLWRLGLVVLLLAMLSGGFLILTSRGNVTQVLGGKKVITIAFSAYALTFLSWAFLNTVFSLIGLMEWTGFFAERGNVTALTSTAITDNTKTWRDDQWLDYMIEIIPPKGVSGLKSLAAGQDLGSVSVSLPIQGVSWSNGQWNGFELMIRSGNQANEIRTIVDTISPNRLVLNRTVGTLLSQLALDDTIDILDFKQQIIRRVSSNTVNSLTIDSPQPLSLAANPSYHILNTGWWSFACGISAAPTANFIAAPSTGGPNLSVESQNIDVPSRGSTMFAQSMRAPLTVYFTDLSQGEIMQWEWDLNGDGDFTDPQDSSAKSPSAFYTSENPITITLRVTGPTGSSTKQQTINFAPQADFIAQDSTGYRHGRAPFTVTFTDNSRRATAWSWEFGDGTRDCCSNSTVTHTYNNPGPFSPRLIVTGPGGTDTKVKLNHIFVYPQPKAPVSDFSYVITPNTLQVTFKNKTLAADGGVTTPDEVTNWTWTITNDDDSSTETITTVNEFVYWFYTNQSGYTVALQADGPGGSNTISRKVVFPPGSDFTTNVQSGPRGSSDGKFPITFTDTSAGTISGLTFTFTNVDAPLTRAQNLWGNENVLYNTNGAFNVSLQATAPGAVYSRLEPDELNAASELKLWLKTDAITGLTNGDFIATWPDSSGAGKNFVQTTEANKPVYIANGINGKPVIRFDGTDDFMKNGVAVDWKFLTDGRKKITAFIVTKVTPEEIDGYSTLLGHAGNDNSKNSFAIHEHKSGINVTFGHQATNGSNAVYPKTDIASKSLDTAYVITAETDLSAANNTAKVRVDGGAATIVNQSNPPSGSNPSYALHLGASGAGTNYAAVDIAEIIIYERELNEFERDQIERYLGNKYAVTIPNPVRSVTETKSSYIVVTPGAYFSVSSAEVYQPTSIAFTDNSYCASCSTRVWDFGDGSTSPKPHTYNNEVYNAWFTVTDTGGRSHRAIPQIIRIWANPKFQISACGDSIEGAPPLGRIDCTGKYSETLTLTNQATTHANIKQWKYEIDYDSLFDGGSVDWTSTKTRPADSPAANFTTTKTLDISPSGDNTGDYSVQFTVDGSAVGETSDLSNHFSYINNFVDFTPIASVTASGPADYASRAGATRTVYFDASASSPNPSQGDTVYSWSGCSAGNVDSCSIIGTATCDGGTYSATVTLTNNGGTASDVDSHNWDCEEPACMTTCADNDHGPNDRDHYRDDGLCIFTANLCGDSRYLEYASCATSEPRRRDDSQCRTLRATPTPSPFPAPVLTNLNAPYARIGLIPGFSRWLKTQLASITDLLDF